MRRAFELRAHQRPMIDFIGSHPRCAVWAGMGMGKTVGALTFLEHLHNVWGEAAPTLVLGPKRVAQQVWTDEARKWKHLAGLDVVTMVGTPAERLAALRRDVPVKAINYDNLPWLVAHAKPWPFRTVVADESTRLKNFRLKQGGTRARALGQVAHKHVERWINLTGTPAPNGLIDLWGQTWFLDGGERLGRTFGGFEDRYFAWKRAGDAMKKGKDGVKQVILEHSQELIHEKLADICLTLDPKDWFDLKEPLVNVVRVDLPRAARALYRELEKEMFLRLDTGDEIEAFNAASLTMKCLQFANGALYLEDGKTWRQQHDEKLDALESLVEEQAGAPLLVAYHFKSDLARLKVRFPDGLDLSVDSGMAAAKAGEGRVWFGHPAGMGHGVDGLQEHCCDVAFFGHWYDLEQHDQFIERVGPMRQFQAGKDRAVTLHYIVAHDTVDDVVMARRGGKRAVQDLLLDYMKGKQ